MVTKDGKKIKKKKKEGKLAKAATATGEGLTEPSADEGKVKGEKKVKKEKKLKEKGAKKKKKIAAAVVEDVPLDDVGVPPTNTVPPSTTDTTTAPKIGKKRKQVTSVDGEKEPDKPKKKKKKKHQTEVLVQPWNDLEGEDDQDDETSKGDNLPEDKPFEVTQTDKNQDEMFSDWSDDDSPVGEDSWLDENSQNSTNENMNKDDTAIDIKDSPVSTDEKGPSFDDVYDPISDDEFDAMYTQSDDEELKKDEQEANKAFSVEDVDWSSLGIVQDANKGKIFMVSGHVHNKHVTLRVLLNSTYFGLKLRFSYPRVY